MKQKKSSVIGQDKVRSLSECKSTPSLINKKSNKVLVAVNHQKLTNVIPVRKVFLSDDENPYGIQTVEDNRSDDGMGDECSVPSSERSREIPGSDYTGTVPTNSIMHKETMFPNDFKI